MCPNKSFLMKHVDFDNLCQSLNCKLTDLIYNTITCLYWSVRPSSLFSSVSCKSWVLSFESFKSQKVQINSFTQRKHLLNMENRFGFSLAPSSPPNLDGTFLLESTEDETKQDETEMVRVQRILFLLLIFWPQSRVSVQGVKSLGSHFAYLCRGFFMK